MNKYSGSLIILLLGIGCTSQSPAYEIVTESNFLCNRERPACEWPETSSVCPSDCGTISISKYTEQSAKYIQEGECTYNGDGFADSCATAEGGRGRFNDMQHALDSLRPGETLYVHPGDYWRGDDEGYVYNSRSKIGYQISGDGNVAHPIIVTALDPNNKPVFHSFDPRITDLSNPPATAYSTDNHPAIEGRIDGSGSYIILDNLEVRGMIGFWRGDFNNSQIQNIDCSVGWGHGDGNWSCIRIEGSQTSNNVVHHNNIHDLAVPSFLNLPHDPRPAGLKEFHSQNTIWEFNTVSRVHDGYDHHHSGSNPTLRFNVFNQTERAGIRYGQSDHSKYTSYTYGNVVHGNPQICIDNVDGNPIPAASGHSEIIYNNLCSNAGRAFMTHRDYNLEFYNNIITSVTPQGGDMPFNIAVPPKTPGTSLYLDHNAYDSTARYSYGVEGYNPMADTLAEWQNYHTQLGLSQEVNSHEAAGDACSFEDAPTSATDTSFDFTPTDSFCTTGSTEGGMLGPYGLVTCIGHTCGDVDDNTVPPLSLSEHSYVVLNPGLKAAGVISMVDNNEITAGDTHLHLDRYEVGTFPPPATLTQGMVVTGTGPFEMGSNAYATDIPAHASMRGTRFVMPHVRVGHLYYLISPDEDTTAQITVDGIPYTIHLRQGVAEVFDAGDNNGNISAVITSDIPILVSHIGDPGGSWFADVSPIPPADRELWGFRNKSAAFGAVEDNTRVTLYGSDGRRTRTIMNAGEKRWINVGDQDAPGQGTGSAVRLVADKPIGAVQIGDGDGMDQTAFFPTSMLNRRFGLPRNAQYIAVACPEANTTITLYNGDNPPQVRICDADGDYPGKAYFGSPSNGTHIQFGAYLESDKPIHVIYEEARSNDERNMIGASDLPLFSSDMEGTSPASDWMDVRSVEAGGGASITFPSDGNSRVAQFNYRAGGVNEVWLRQNFGSHGAVEEPPVNELWINFEYLVNDTGVFNPVSYRGSKILLVNWSNPDNDDRRSFQVVLGAMHDGSDHVLVLDWNQFDRNNGRWLSGRWLDNNSTIPIPENEKLYLQLHIRNSTNGEANGLVQLYNNGELIAERNNVALNDSFGDYPTHFLLSTHNSQANGITDGYAQYDNVELYDSDPGAFTAP